MSIDDAYILQSSGTQQNTTEPRKTILASLSEVSEDPTSTNAAGLIIPSIDVYSPSQLDKTLSQAASPSVATTAPSFLPKQEEPEKLDTKNLSTDKKKARRIRTKSKVETVL